MKEGIDKEWYLIPGFNHTKMLRDAEYEVAAGKTVMIHHHRASEPCNHQCKQDPLPPVAWSSFSI